MKRFFFDFQGNLDLSKTKNLKNIHVNLSSPFEAIYFALAPEKMIEQYTKDKEKEKEEAKIKAKKRKEKKEKQLQKNKES